MRHPEFQNIKAVLLDAGSTLITEIPCYKKRIKDTIKADSLSISEDAFFALILKGAKLQQNPYDYALSQLGNPPRVPWDFSSEELYPGVPDLLKALQAHYRLALIANQPPHFLPRVQKLGLDSSFEEIWGSDDVGLKKPDPAFFTSLLAKLSLKPAEACMVGDRLENDIRPAKALGMKTIWVKQGVSRVQAPMSEEEIPTASVGEITEIASLLL
jgi:HAD superfamily hydrolase (TIGR01662 family)